MAEWLGSSTFVYPSFHGLFEFLRKRGFAQTVIIVSDAVEISLSHHVTLCHRVRRRSNDGPVTPMHRKRRLSDDYHVRVRHRTTVTTIC